MSFAILKKWMTPEPSGGKRLPQYQQPETRILPPEIWQHIAAFLTIHDLKALSCTCWFLRACTLRSLLHTVTINGRVDSKQPFRRMGLKVTPEVLEYIQELHYTYEQSDGSPLTHSFVSNALEFYDSFNLLRQYRQMTNLRTMKVYRMSVHTSSQQTILSHPGLSTLSLHHSTWRQCRIEQSTPCNITTLILTGPSNIHKSAIAIIAPKLQVLECQLSRKIGPSRLVVFEVTYPRLESLIITWSQDGDAGYELVSASLKNLLARTTTIKNLCLFVHTRTRLVIPWDSLPFMPNLESYTANSLSAMALTKNRKSLQSLHLINKFHRAHLSFDVSVLLSQILSGSKFIHLKQIIITTYEMADRDLHFRLGIDAVIDFLPNLQALKLVLVSSFTSVRRWETYGITLMEGVKRDFALPWNGSLPVQIRTLTIGHLHLKSPEELGGEKLWEQLVNEALVPRGPGLTEIQFVAIHSQNRPLLEARPYDNHLHREQVYQRFCLDETTGVWKSLRVTG